MQTKLLTRSFFMDFITKIPLIFDETILQMNRNARAPKKANHGARPCSSVVRRLRHAKQYRKSKENTPLEQEELTSKWDDL
ncbi:unnamed protein product [Paramecium sonneborni]|uniref:Uncharacterized protein n=1 Tax=Paramecium sonneborni TaxID=65129 RepID=A0A8S1QKZ0_9CILI|nr:unnamed protein product [Paramecium sonneborni]